MLWTSLDTAVHSEPTATPLREIGGVFFLVTMMTFDCVDSIVNTPAYMPYMVFFPDHGGKTRCTHIQFRIVEHNSSLKAFPVSNVSPWRFILSSLILLFHRASAFPFETR